MHSHRNWIEFQDELHGFVSGLSNKYNINKTMNTNGNGNKRNSQIWMTRGGVNYVNKNKFIYSGIDHKLTSSGSDRTKAAFLHRLCFIQLSDNMEDSYIIISMILLLWWSFKDCQQHTKCLPAAQTKEERTFLKYNLRFHLGIYIHDFKCMYWAVKHP